MNDTEEFLAKVECERQERVHSKSEDAPTAQPTTQASKPPETDDVQWGVHPNGVFMACGRTQAKLPPAVYGIEVDSYGNLIFVTKRVITDELVVLPDTASERVLTAIQTFWRARDKFKALGQLFKRGVMLWGEPGGLRLRVLDMVFGSNGMGSDLFYVKLDTPFSALYAFYRERVKGFLCFVVRVEAAVRAFKGLPIEGESMPVTAKLVNILL